MLKCVKSAPGFCAVMATRAVTCMFVLLFQMSCHVCATPHCSVDLSSALSQCLTSMDSSERSHLWIVISTIQGRKPRQRTAGVVLELPGVVEKRQCNQWWRRSLWQRTLHKYFYHLSVIFKHFWSAVSILVAWKSVLLSAAAHNVK